MIAYIPSVDIAVLLAFGVVFGAICYFADKRAAKKKAA